MNIHINSGNLRKSVVLLVLSLYGERASLLSQTEPKINRLEGVYRLVEGKELPPDFKSQGDLNSLPLTPKATEIVRKTKLEDDSTKLCLPAGPFRMMAWKGNIIDLYQSSDRITMLFQDLYDGHMRSIYTDGRPHIKSDPLWEGDSVGSWKNGSLVVETTNFNPYLWLNDAGAPHSEGFRLREVYTPLKGGEYLRVDVTATDPEMLTKPFTYVRYYRKTNEEVQERVCWADTAPLGR